MTRDISNDLTKIRNLMLEGHEEMIGHLGVEDWEWLSAMSNFDECGCKLCQAMVLVTALEVNLTLGHDLGAK